MWKNYIPALKLYYNLSIQEWIKRGYKNNMKLLPIEPKKIVLPEWLGFKLFHSSHRANLLRKYPDHYSKLGWKELPSDIYVWLNEKNEWYYQKKGSTEKIIIDKKTLSFTR